jgi:hypothetical protein
MHECFLDVNGKPALRVLPITSARHATSANTDNIVYKLVTFFAVYSYSKSCFCQALNPDTLIGRKVVPALGVMNYLRVTAPRSCTTAFGHTAAPGLDTGHISACTAKHTKRNYPCTWRQKMRHASLLPASDNSCGKLEIMLSASSRSATLTNSIAGPLAYIHPTILNR